MLALLSVLGGGAAFAAVEKGHHQPELSAWDGVWWAVTTVGYGDIGPKTDAGRGIAMAVMVVIGFVAILTAAAAERFMRHQREEDRRLERKLDEVVARLDGLDLDR